MLGQRARDRGALAVVDGEEQVVAPPMNGQARLRLAAVVEQQRIDRTALGQAGNVVADEAVDERHAVGAREAQVTVCQARQQHGPPAEQGDAFPIRITEVIERRRGHPRRAAAGEDRLGQQASPDLARRRSVWRVGASGFVHGGLLGMLSGIGWPHAVT